jgi:hypothetical protein
LIHFTKEEPMSSSPLASVLFVCVHNAGRSQMAAGFGGCLGGAETSEPEPRVCRELRFSGL